MLFPECRFTYNPVNPVNPDKRGIDHDIVYLKNKFGGDIIVSHGYVAENIFFRNGRTNLHISLNADGCQGGIIQFLSLDTDHKMQKHVIILWTPLHAFVQFSQTSRLSTPISWTSFLIVIRIFNFLYF